MTDSTFPVLFPEPSDKLVCPRPHLDDATLPELLKAIQRNGTFDTPVGPMQVFREYLPRTGMVEYTVYFRDRADNKMRLNYSVTEEDIHNMVDPEGEIRDTIFNKIAEGQAEKVDA